MKIGLNLAEAEAFAAELEQRRRLEATRNEKPRDLAALRREDAIVVLWQALLDERKRQPCSHSQANPDSDASTH